MRAEKQDLGLETEPDIPLFTAVMTFFGYGLLMAFGYLRDICGYVCGKGSTATREGYAPLLKDFEDFYTRRLYHRIKDCWNRPIASCPGAHIDVMQRERVGHMSQPLQISGARVCV
jgi:serine palmitoyltransferase